MGCVIVVELVDRLMAVDDNFDTGDAPANMLYRLRSILFDTQVIYIYIN